MKRSSARPSEISLPARYRTPALGQQLIRCGAAIGDDQRNAAGARFRRDHAESLGLAAMDQRIGARQQARQLVAVRRAAGEPRLAHVVGKALELAAPRPVADEHQPDRTPTRATSRDRADHHVPALLAGQAPDADQQ